MEQEINEITVKTNFGEYKLSALQYVIIIEQPDGQIELNGTYGEGFGEQAKERIQDYEMGSNSLWNKKSERR